MNTLNDFKRLNKACSLILKNARSCSISLDIPWGYIRVVCKGYTKIPKKGRRNQAFFKVCLIVNGMVYTECFKKKLDPSTQICGSHNFFYKSQLCENAFVCVNQIDLNGENFFCVF